MSIFTTEAANDNIRSKGREDLIGALVRTAQKLLPDELSFAEVEGELLAISNELVRRALEQRLRTISGGFADELDVTMRGDDGSAAGTVRYRRHDVGTIRYHSLCGSIEVERWTYRVVGKRNGPTIVPLDLTAGLILRATPGLAYALTQGHAKQPIRSVEDDLHAAHRQPPSRATMDRIARDIGLRVGRVVPVIEPVVRAEEQLPIGAHAINIGLDRTSVPMEELLDEEKKRTKKRPRITVRYRMGYVGTICVTNRRGEVLCAWRYAAPAHEGPHQILDRMIADVNHALEQKPRLKLGVVQDGAPEMWNLVREALRANDQTKTREWRETVDRYHFMERLASVLDAFYPTKNEAEERRKLLESFRRELDRSDQASKRIRDWLERESYRLDGGPLGKKSLWLFFYEKLDGYMLPIEHFHYASLGKNGLHSGSGVTEAACKFLIASRAKRSGQRWTKDGISAVLALRSLLGCERLRMFWEHFATTFTADCRRAA